MQNIILILFTEHESVIQGLYKTTETDGCQ
jgi:hypothetical protein